MRIHTQRERQHLIGQILLVAAVAFVTACADSIPPTDPFTGNSADAVLGRQLVDIKHVQEKYTPGWMRKAGILGSGIAVSSNVPRIVVYAQTVDHGRGANIPLSIEGHPVDVVVTGMFQAISLSDPRTRERPAPNGFSVGHYAATAGTIAAKVRDAAGNFYILSNNHVIANGNTATIGDRILQPGPYDGGKSADSVAKLFAFEPLRYNGAGTNTMDAAIARLTNVRNLLGVTPSYAYGAPNPTVYGGTLQNLAVKKFGRTTGLTRGTISEVNVTTTVCYQYDGYGNCFASALFVGQLGIQPGSFIDFGDSGSLVVTDDAGKQLVGLVFGKSSVRALANPIQPILTRFGITVDTTRPPVTAIISGADVVGQAQACKWTADVSPGLAPYTYKWSGVLSGTSQSVSGTLYYSGALNLEVRDAGGTVSTHTKYVQVYGTYHPCPSPY